MRHFLLLLCCVLVACIKTVQLKAPTLDASEEVRVEAYLELSPTEIERVILHTRDSSVVVLVLHLSNGAQIYNPEDLLPVVGPDSKTAKHLREFAAQKKQIRRRLGIFGASLVVGPSLLGVGLLVSESLSITHPRLVILGNGIMVMGGASLLLGLASFFYTNVPNHGMDENKALAYYYFDQSLKQRLNLCLALGSPRRPQRPLR
jgi:hypothetical protein